jgi:hypothetical protein
MPVVAPAELDSVAALEDPAGDPASICAAAAGLDGFEGAGFNWSGAAWLDWFEGVWIAWPVDVGLDWLEGAGIDGLDNAGTVWLEEATPVLASGALFPCAVPPERAPLAASAEA